MRRSTIAVLSLVAAGILAAPSPAEAQYFGRNKVQYESFDFRMLATEHFDINHYGDPSAALAAGPRARISGDPCNPLYGAGREGVEVQSLL